MNAKELKELSDQNNRTGMGFWKTVFEGGLSNQELEDWAKGSFDEVYSYVEAFVESFLEERAKNGYYKALLEPFQDLPSPLHKAAVEDQIMEKLVASFDEGFLVEWNRRDDRVVLEVSWR